MVAMMMSMVVMWPMANEVGDVVKGMPATDQPHQSKGNAKSTKTEEC
jgi:hypothetical protein